MARLLNEEGNLNEALTETETQEGSEELETVAAEPAQEEPQAVSEPEEEIPEKYRNKSVHELVRMHQEAEKAIGKQGSEVGELRKLVDTYIQNQLVEAQAPTKQTVQEQEEEIDWFADPDKALEAKLNTHPTIKAMEESTKQSHRQASQARLAEKHPDAAEIVQDESFAKWIKDSKIRTQLFVQADQQYDVDAADELFSTWKERKALASKTVEADKAVRKAEVKHAATGGASGSSSSPALPKYRRSDIINMRTKDPELYAQRAAEILQAYADGRVV